MVNVFESDNWNKIMCPCIHYHIRRGGAIVLFCFSQTHMSFFGATGTPVLDFWWCILWVLKPEWVLPYSLFVEANVMYIPQDPPMVLHMPTSWQPASPPVLSPHTVAEVRLPGFELVLSEYLWVRRSTNWAKPGPTSYCLYTSCDPSIWSSLTCKDT